MGATLALPLESLIGSTPAGRALLSAADAAAQRSAIGLGTAALAATGDFSAASHTHSAANVTDFDEAARDAIGAALVAGSNITITVNDAANTITVAASGGSPGGASGQVQYNNAGAFGG